MKITGSLTDETILEEMGARLSGARLVRNLTQAALAEQAGVSKRTLERLEAGAVASQLSSLLRVCRVLGLLEQFDLLIPEALAGPMEKLRRKGHQRKRASGKRKTATQPKKWTWGDEA